MPRRLVPLILAALLPTHPAGAATWDLDTFWGRTELQNLTLSGGSSNVVAGVAASGYELSGGEFQSLSRWYTPPFQDVTATFLTQLDAQSYLQWGLGTGEAGEKYAIAPSLILGAIRLWDLPENGHLSLSLRLRFGGELSESSCRATYFIGEEEVNCRLAASVLPPAETLDFLWQDPPRDRIEVKLQYVLAF